MAAGRGAYIDQSQSLNLFMESPTIGKLSSMYMHAWKQGLKTTYYLRSRPATRINKTTTAGSTTTTSPNGGGVPATPLPTRDAEPAVQEPQVDEVAPTTTEVAPTEAEAVAPPVETVDAPVVTEAPIVAGSTVAAESDPAVEPAEPVVPTAAGPAPTTPSPFTDEEALACSLENPESCEACQ